MTDETTPMEGNTSPVQPNPPQAPHGAGEERGGGGMGRAIIWLIILVILAAGGYKWYQSRKTAEPVTEEPAAEQTAPTTNTDSGATVSTSIEIK